MYIQEYDVLRYIFNDPQISKEDLSARSGHPTRILDRILDSLHSHGYLDAEGQLTSRAMAFAAERKPENAVILTAGYGMRMVPISHATPKALLEVDGEILIERMIRQLQEADVHDITVVTGFRKEDFRYLREKYSVHLIENDDYAVKNNLHSLALAADRIHNTYIMPCDLWAGANPFTNVELYSWYMINNLIDDNSIVRGIPGRVLHRCAKGTGGNSMVGIAYILREDAPKLVQRLQEMDKDPAHDNDRWEEALFQNDIMFTKAHFVRASEVINVNTYEHLRALDFYSVHLQSEAIETICLALDARPYEIRDIQVLKKGMTNRSFLFTCRDTKYIMRIPGEGTDQLVDRNAEAEIYRVISGQGFCDDPLYIDPQTGYKLSLFLEGVRTCNADDPEDLKACMALLRRLHSMKLHTGHVFDLFEKIEAYEKLWGEFSSVHPDHAETKAHVWELKPFIEANAEPFCLTHIDANADNFLFYPTEDGEKLQLTDWEYAGMQDPHVDIAMFCIYSMYDRKQTERLINIYFGDTPCSERTRAMIYCYIAVCGLLWSDWCEYKSHMGIEFDRYARRQYRYAKDYYRIAAKAIAKLTDETNR